MKKFLLYLLLCQIISSVCLYSQSEYPKREFRAAWISTVANIDWPKNAGDPVDKMKQDLIAILDYLKDVNLNAVVFQIRPSCDALYYSEIEPWSSWLTGKQGRAPSPFFDPLEFAVEEAHKRGMEIHTWFNPYRIRWASWNLQLDSKNVAVQHPDWVLSISGDEILDPGIPEVREHVFNVVMDVVQRYDIDGVHFDDYFYLEGITNHDDATFAQYNRGFTNRSDWRRDNVNELLRMIYAGIQAEKPHVKFGQSPAGIWKSGVPEGIFGRSAYSAIYCDAVAWLDEQIIDYLTPQLYWPFGLGQDYGKLLPWWVEQRNSRHIIPGLPLYRVGEALDRTQIGKMIKLNRSTEGCYGEVYFTANDFPDNHLNNTDTLKNHYYKYKAIIPSMGWKDIIAPSQPTNVRFDRVAGLGTTALTWDKPLDTDIARYVLYSFDQAGITENDIEDAAKIFDVTSKNYYPVTESFPTENKFYVVTALDHNNNESQVSEIFEFQPNIVVPSVPILAYPTDGNGDQGETVTIGWNYAQNAGTYQVQVAIDELFTNLLINAGNIVDTFYTFTGLTGETTYYWKVKSINIAGESNYSNLRTFTTAFPAAPVLALPLDQQLDVELQTNLSWIGRSDAINYNIQLYEGLSITSEALILDETLTDTVITTPQLKSYSIYSWRVRVTNNFGTSTWSNVFKFRTLSILPGIPQLVYPNNNDNTIPGSIELKWSASDYADSYQLQVAYDDQFANKFYEISSHVDTSIILYGLAGETKYYWKVRARNNAGSSQYSDIYSFTTGFPADPILIYPAHQQLNLEISPVLRWSKSSVAENYDLQVSEDVSINPAKMIVDETIIDTAYQLHNLVLNKIYAWRVKSKNSIGESNWSSAHQFKTTNDTTSIEYEPVLPKEYALYQNYPNPFNPVTIIKFDLPRETNTSLKIYNLLGQEILTLINSNLSPGRFNIEFDGGNLPSGIYFYVLSAGERVFTKKMMLIK